MRDSNAVFEIQKAPDVRPQLERYATMWRWSFIETRGFELQFRMNDCEHFLLKTLCALTPSITVARVVLNWTACLAESHAPLSPSLNMSRTTQRKLSLRCVGRLGSGCQDVMSRVEDFQTSDVRERESRLNRLLNSSTCLRGTAAVASCVLAHPMKATGVVDVAISRGVCALEHVL